MIYIYIYIYLFIYIYIYNGSPMLPKLCRELPGAVAPSLGSAGAESGSGIVALKEPLWESLEEPLTEPLKERGLGFRV